MSDLEVFEHARPALKLICKHHEANVLKNALRAIILLETDIIPKPTLIYYNKLALLFGWSQVALHLFHDERIYVQAFYDSNIGKRYTFVEYPTIKDAIKACKQHIEK